MARSFALPMQEFQELDLQRDEMRRLGFTCDYCEGVVAFLEKRAAKFEGR